MTFLIHTLVGFITEYLPKDATKPERRLYLIAQNYVMSEFLFNLIPLIPFTEIIKNQSCRKLFLIKCIRIRSTLVMLNS